VNDEISQLSSIARRAAQARDWAKLSACANEILTKDKTNPEGHFLAGLVEKAAGRAEGATKAFSQAISLDSGRYDAAIELAAQYAISLRHADALDLLRRYESLLVNSPLYLDMAANTYSRLGLHAQAWPLYQKANQLQPDIDLFQANLAACAVYLGKIAEAKVIYESLLVQHPNHQRNHYQLSGLERARDSSHVEQMKKVLSATKLPADKNIFLYYAIGKELEDLEQWQEAFQYYKLAGDSVSSVANYDVDRDIELIDRVIEVCNAEWLAEGLAEGLADGLADGIKRTGTSESQRTPIFVVGLPRTGTTLIERIISSHSKVESIDETFFMQVAVRQVSGVAGREEMNPAIIAAAATKEIGLIAQKYLNAVDYRLGDKPIFIDKLPENFIYIGFIAKAFPDAHMIHLRRNPMDACFAMYKQSFFKYAYTLENLGRYYVAFDRLRRHWQHVLEDRLIEVEYESMVAGQEAETRILLGKLGLEFEQACIDFEQNVAPSATASSVQVREKVHSRSVGNWKHFEGELQPLRSHLENSGILLA
tara:strand:- start:5422 stop:7032 length:1611 start_codon:yes stop_codon:yes gene_type:complete